MKRLRVVKDANQQHGRFLSAIARIQPASGPAEEYVIGAGAKLQPKVTGRLILYPNDWPGLDHMPKAEAGFYDEKSHLKSPTYGNNSGYLSITITQNAPR